MRSNIFNKLFGRADKDAAAQVSPPPLTTAEKVEKQEELFASFAAVTAIGKNTTLVQAVKLGDHARVEALLKEGADKNMADAEGRPALWLAIDKMNNDIALLLISAGADTSSRDAKGNTLLIHAAYHGSVEVAAALLDKNPDLVNAVNKQRQTALHQLGAIAADLNNVEMANLLISRGAYIDARDNRGQTLAEIAHMAQGRKDDLLACLAAADALPGTKHAPPLYAQDFQEGTAAPIRSLKTVRFKPQPPKLPA